MWRSHHYYYLMAAAVASDAKSLQTAVLTVDWLRANAPAARQTVQWMWIRRMLLTDRTHDSHASAQTDQDPEQRPAPHTSSPAFDDNMRREWALVATRRAVIAAFGFQIVIVAYAWRQWKRSRCVCSAADKWNVQNVRRSVCIDWLGASRLIAVGALRTVTLSLLLFSRCRQTGRRLQSVGLPSLLIGLNLICRICGIKACLHTAVAESGESQLWNDSSRRRTNTLTEACKLNVVFF